MPEPLIFDEKTGLYNLTNQILITKILKNELKDPNVSIKTVKIAKGSNPGDNYMSQIERITAIAKNSEGDKIEKKFIMKVDCHSPERKEILQTDKVWANEEFIYESLFPYMEEVCNTDLPHPKYYYGDETIILMEDLSEKGYRIGDRRNGLNLNHTYIVMDKLAKFHAASLAYYYKNKNEFATLIKNFNHPYSSTDTVKNTIPYVQQKIMDAINLLKTINRSEKYENALDYLNESMVNVEKTLYPLERMPDGDTCVLSHGDLWVNNIMFLYNDADEPVDAKFVDFQGTRPGSMAKDILYFIYVSVEPSVRNQHFDRILIYYHDKMTEYLRNFIGANDDEYLKKFNYETFYNECVQYRMYGLVNAIMMLPMTLYDSNNCDYDFLSSETRTNNDKLRERLSDIVDDYINKGWIKS